VGGNRLRRKRTRKQQLKLRATLRNISIACVVSMAAASLLFTFQLTRPAPNFPSISPAAVLSPQATPSRTQPYPFKPMWTTSGVAVVLDGDTLLVNRIRVRLNGVDAEELSEPHGPAARSALQEIIGVGSEIACGFNGEKTWDREVGVCFNGANQDVGAELIRKGHALDCEHFSRGRYRALEPSGARSRLISKQYCK